MPEPCPACAEVHAVFRDFDNRPWRWLCVVESEQRCFKGPHPATHARLTASGAVERFACDDHGVPPEEREGAGEQPKHAPLVQSPKAPKAKPAKAPAPEPAKAATPTRLEAAKAHLQGITGAVFCKPCGKEVKYKGLNVIIDDTNRLDYECPHCWGRSAKIAADSAALFATIEDIYAPKKKRPVSEPEVKHDLRTIEGFKASIKDSTEIVQCTNVECRLRTVFSTWVVKLDEDNLPRPYCPNCGKGHARFLGQLG